MNSSYPLMFLFLYRTLFSSMIHTTAKDLESMLPRKSQRTSVFFRNPTIIVFIFSFISTFKFKSYPLKISLHMTHSPLVT